MELQNGMTIDFLPTGKVASGLKWRKFQIVKFFFQLNSCLVAKIVKIIVIWY